MNLLVNSEFEDGSHKQEFNEIYVPNNWTAFWLELKGVPHDPFNTVGYVRPEMKVIKAEAPYLVPPRIYNDDHALKWFGQWKIFKAGIYQQVHVPAGTELSAWYMAHAWSSREDNAKHSDVDTDEDFENIAFQVGIDLTGGIDPDSSDVVWSDNMYIYDEYDQVGPVYATAQENMVTMFIRATAEWPLKHNDVYIDSAVLQVESWPGDGGCGGLPRIDYERTYLCLPQDATEEDAVEAARLAYPNRRTMGYCPDDMGVGALSVKYGEYLYPKTTSYSDVGGRVGLNNFMEMFYSDVMVSHSRLYYATPEPPAPPTPPPPTGWVPKRYIPKGWTGGIHSIGDDGSGDMFVEMNKFGASMNAMKAVSDFGWMRNVWLDDKSVQSIGRIIDLPNTGSLEWFDSTKPIREQAEVRYYTLRPTWEKHREYFKYWEYMNEQDPVGPAGHALKAEFSMDMMELANNDGFKLALFSDSMGCPEPEEWDAMAETGVFEMAAHGGHSLALHEYGIWPTDAISLLTRYRYPYATYILPHQLDIPLFITEWAPNAWNLTVYSLDFLMGQIAAYDQETAKDPYFAGFTIFTLGGSGSWPLHREPLNKLRARIVQYAISQKDRVNG